MNIIEAVVETLKKQPKEYSLAVIFQLMRDNHITFADVVNEHVRHLEMMNKVENEKMIGLQTRVTHMWCDYKKNWRTNLKECMRYLKDLGRVNITDEQIDKF